MPSRSLRRRRARSATPSKRPLAAFVFVGLGAWIGAAAAAQDASPAGYLTLGSGVAVGPKYSGSKDLAVRPIPLIDYGMTDGVFISTLRGIGFAAGAGDFGASAAVNYRGGRLDHATHGVFGSGGDALRGMGDIRPSAVAALGVTYRLSQRFGLSAAVDVPLSHRDNGVKARFGATESMWKDGVDELSLGASLNAGDRRYMQTWYGVTPTQSLDSGLAVHAPKAGLYSADASLKWTHRFSSQWMLTGTAGATRLLHDAAGSPVVERRVSPVAALMVGYTY